MILYSHSGKDPDRIALPHVILPRSSSFDAFSFLLWQWQSPSHLGVNC